MIQILPCPACHRSLVLAAETSLQAVLRCRHCSHQFVLGEMIEAELGFWEVVDDANATEPKVTSAANHAADEPEPEPDLELAKSEEYVSPQMLLKKQVEKKNVDWSKFEPISHDQYERMRRKGKSPIWSMLSVLFGGLASIPIATLLIWHVLGKDPLRMGPVVGRYIPWVVPTRFQPFKPNLVDDNLQPTPPVTASQFRRFDDVMNASPSDSPDQTTESPANSAPAANEASETNSTAEKAADNLFAQINQVEKDLQAWNKRGDDREANKKLAYETYANLSVLALAIDALPAASPQKRLVRAELNSVGREVSQHIDIQQLIQYCSADSLTNNQGDRIGLAIVTKVAEASEAEQSWFVKPSPTSGEAMQIVVPKEIIPSLSAGQNLLVVGSLKKGKPATDSESIDSSSSSKPIFTANYVHVLEP